MTSAPAMTSSERLGRSSARHHRLVIIAWIALLALAAPFAVQVGGALRSGGFVRDDLESARTKALLEREIGTPQTAAVVVFHSEMARAGEPAFEIPAAAAVAALPSAPYVTALLPHTLVQRQVSADRHTAYDVV